MGTLRVAAILSGLVLAANMGRAEEQPGDVGSEPTYRIACQWWTELPQEMDARRLEEPPVPLQRAVQRGRGGRAAHEPADRRAGPARACSCGRRWPIRPMTARSGRAGAPTTRPRCCGPIGAARPSAMPRPRALRSARRSSPTCPGAEDVKTGIEPLFAWVRVSIQQVEPKADAPAKYAFSYKLYGPAIGRSMEQRSNLRYAWQPYPRQLVVRARPRRAALRHVCVEPDGKIRLAVAASEGMPSRFPPRREGGRAADRVRRPARRNGLDLLLPMIPTPRGDRPARSVCSATTRHWPRPTPTGAKLPATAATIDVPEEEINRAIRSLSEDGGGDRREGPGHRRVLHPDRLLDVRQRLVHAQLDAAGLAAGPHGIPCPGGAVPGRVPRSTRARPFRRESLQAAPRLPRHAQGLPGDQLALGQRRVALGVFASTPCSPATRSSSQTYSPAIVKSCEWIRDARRITGHGGIEGHSCPAPWPPTRDARSSRSGTTAGTTRG